MKHKFMSLLSVAVTQSMLLAACGGSSSPSAVPAAAPTEDPAW